MGEKVCFDFLFLDFTIFQDYIKNIITNDLNGTIHFGRVNMKPGKPTTFATFEKSNTLFFGLPGKSISNYKS